MNAKQLCVKIVLVFTFVFHNNITSSVCFDQRNTIHEDYNPGFDRPLETDVTRPPEFDSHTQYNSELPRISEHPDSSSRKPDSNTPSSGSGSDVQYSPESTRLSDSDMPPILDSNVALSMLDFDVQEYPRIPRPNMPPPAFGPHDHPHYHRPWHDMHDRGPSPEDRIPLKIKYPGVPQHLRVYPLPLNGSDHQLQFNVSWAPPIGIQPLDYSLEVTSETATEDCRMSICLEYNIPKNAVSSLIPKVTDHVSGNCAFNPGCSYLVQLTANPWDGHTAAVTRIDLDECTADVCSCAHSSRLPAPLVTAHTVHIERDSYANISWSLPTPEYPQRLPKGLAKKSYVVSLGKQMVSDAHPAPWFYNIMELVVDADNAVSEGDTEKWRLLPLGKSGEERTDERSGESIQRPTPGVKLLARVNLIDERGCTGPAGNATAYDPGETAESSFMIYALWALGGGICVCVMMLILIAGVRAMKKALIALRPAPTDVLEPLRHRSTWLPLHLRPVFQEISQDSFTACRGLLKVHLCIYEYRSSEKLLILYLGNFKEILFTEFYIKPYSFLITYYCNKI